MAATVGDRIRARREQLGLSQARLVRDMPLSSTYISLIETGQRQPRERVLELLAKRLDCTVEYLTTGRGGANEADMVLELRFAELALASGDPATARVRFQQILEAAENLRYDEIRLHALWGRSRAEEALGRLEDAIAGFLDLAAEDDLPSGLSRTLLMMHLSRTYAACGDLDRAVEVGEVALAETRRTDDELLDTDEVTALASTLVGCYYLRGHLTQAHILIREVIEEAERCGSVRARAAAYWNAGLVAESRGDLAAALRYTERALTLYGETNSARSTAQLRSNYAWLLLRAPIPDHATAEELLRRSLAEMAEVGSPIDVATTEIELARCLTLGGRPVEARKVAEDALARLHPEAPLEAARARTVLGNAQLAIGEPEVASVSFTAACEQLAQLGASRQSAEVWTELGDGFTTMGLYERAAMAYRRAVSVAGVLTLPQHRMRAVARVD